MCRLGLEGDNNANGAGDRGQGKVEQNILHFGLAFSTCLWMGVGKLSSESPVKLQISKTGH